MAGIPGIQLCELLETDYARFDSRKRRARAIVGASTVARVDHAGAAVLPIKSLARWDRFDLEDVVMFGIALEGERSGLAFDDAAKIAVAADASRVLTHDHSQGDFFVGRAKLGGGRTLHAGAPWSRWIEFLADEATPPDSLLTINASKVFRLIKERATSLGFAEALGLDPPPASLTPERELEAQQ